MSEAEIKNPAGRPTEYKPEYCEMLIEHMSQGLSFECFAAVIGVTEKTLYNWRDNNPAFLQSFDQAKAKCRIFWEKQGIKGMWSGKEFNQAVWAKNISNRFREQWTDQSKTEIAAPTGINIKIDTDDSGL